jgi:hypothetical protein
MQTTVPKAWQRPHHVAVEDHAFLLYWVFGEFQPAVEIDARRYRTRGLPAGISGQVYLHESIRDTAPDPLADPMGAVLRAKAPASFDAARNAPHAMLIRGELPDQPDLQYLRDVIGFIESLVDAGGVAVLDVQSLALRSADQWREVVFEPDAPRAVNEVVMLRSTDARHPGRTWLHTRGLRKFARPDLSITNVPSDSVFNAQLILERAADFLIAGGVFADGREVRMSVAPPGLIAHTSGDLEDPDFNNRHTEFTWPL